MPDQLPLHRYIKRPGQPISAVQLDLETEGFTYRKWGAIQHCKPGDWIVNNAGECYTIDATTFAETYRESGPGQYVKITPVWARVAVSSGSVETKEGISHYEAGDYIVSNKPDGSDTYCMRAEKFLAMYTRDELMTATVKSAKGRAAALSRLNEALLAAEHRIYDMNFGVEASVTLPDGMLLKWSRCGGSWQLTVSDVPLLNLSLTRRIEVPHHLQALVEALLVASDEALSQIHAATDTARNFAEGLLDD